MSSQEPKAQLEPIQKVEGSATAIEVDHTHDPVASGADFDNESPWNFFLILSCFTVGASSVLFGYDDKIVSPVAAMTPFVCCKTRISYLVNVYISNQSIGGAIPRT